MSALNELERLILGRTAPSAVKAILAAGYRKPQQVTTVEELDALPSASVILDAVSYCRESAKLTDGSNWWRSMGPSKVRRSREIPLPATVLHVGSVEA